MSKCKYYRESDIEKYVPECCIEYGEITNTVHPYDADEWTFCPFCGDKIKIKDGVAWNE